MEAAMGKTRLMPEPMRLGEHMQTTVMTPHFNWENQKPDPLGRRMVMGYYLPYWQRGIVWTDAQQIKLIQSIWLGLNIGTYTINHSPSYGGKFDKLLIDGQQRLFSLQRYFEDAFTVFGYRWSEVTESDRRGFLFSRHFSSYITKTDDEEYLRNYYDMMNFGGTAHKESERANGGSDG